MGAGEFECLSDGQWSQAEPTCQPNVCGFPPTVRNASPKAGETLHVDDARRSNQPQTMNFSPSNNQKVCVVLEKVICIRGYPVKPKCMKRSFDCHNAIFFFHCHTTACKDNALHYSPGLEIEYAYGDTVIYECNKGYTLSGKANSLACEASGLFSNATITCNPVSCPSITPPAHGKLLQENCEYLIAKLIGRYRFVRSSCRLLHRKQEHYWDLNARYV